MRNISLIFLCLILVGCVEETPLSDLGITTETVIQCRDSAGKFAKCD